MFISCAVESTKKQPTIYFAYICSTFTHTHNFIVNTFVICKYMRKVPHIVVNDCSHVYFKRHRE